MATDSRIRLSMIDQVIEHMDKGAEAALGRFTTRNLKDIVIWLESWQLHKSLSLAAMDSPQEYVRTQGMIELVLELNSQVTEELGKRLSAKAKQGEDDDER